MRTRAAVVVAILVTAGTTLWASPAKAGGGCHSAATQGRGTSVKLEGACFLPTVLRVADGTTVTFTNADPFTHVVSGVGIDYTELTTGAAVQQTFHGPGVYPFMCHLHPGMSGAIVVGDGLGNAQVVDVQTVTTLAPRPVATEPVATVSAEHDTSPAVLALIAALALGLGFTVGLLVRARRRTTAD